MNLREYLEEYRALTLLLIDEVKKDGELNDLVEKREDILKSINDLNLDMEEIKTIGNSLNLIKLEEELQDMYKKEKVKIKKQIENIKRAKKANQNYNNIGNISRVFNKTI